MAGAVAGCLMAVNVSAVLGEGVPIPRPKPGIVPASAKAKPSGIPLPRPKPGTGARSQAAPSADAIAAGKGGELKVNFNRLGRERDPNAASELRPSEKSKWTKADIKAARERCQFVLAATNLDAKPIDPIGGPGGCGIAAPLLVKSFGAVRVRPAAKLNCTMAATLYKWVTDELQPAARKGFKQPVVEITSFAAYQCRSRRGVAGGRISEHAFGNALDIGAFKLASGETVSVLKDWSSTGSFFGINNKAKLLTRAHKGACKSFATVLGPKANKAHENHFHFDLGRDGRYKICK